MSVSREAGDRCCSQSSPNVDAIGTIVGRSGAQHQEKVVSQFTQRLDALRQELKFLLRKILTLFNGLKIS